MFAHGPPRPSTELQPAPVRQYFIVIGNLLRFWYVTIPLALVVAVIMKFRPASASNHGEAQAPVTESAGASEQDIREAKERVDRERDARRRELGDQGFAGYEQYRSKQ